jgi:hypothetical protein
MERRMLSAVAAKPRRARYVAGIEMPHVDGRTLAARRYRRLVAAYFRELGGELTEAERATVRQAAGLQLRVEQLQSAIVAGHDVSTDELVRLSSEHRRLLTGLRGKAEKARPDAPMAIDQYLRDKYGAPAEDESEA